jgi:hypothetical protein
MKQGRIIFCFIFSADAVPFPDENRGGSSKERGRTRPVSVQQFKGTVSRIVNSTIYDISLLL